ncbi:MAG: hypothetical protein A2X08_07235 [Bacteroidetes bacterium GWA2_32_17]|nr:MAG: hypothetical protein A2X08_07235 [Bacteroidetes bacterium GWA2_32_17]
MTNNYNTVLYLGVTSDLQARIYQHKNKEFPHSFTAKYNCNKYRTACCPESSSGLIQHLIQKDGGSSPP